jgi:hypothetical protein
MRWWILGILFLASCTPATSSTSSPTTTTAANSADEETFRFLTAPFEQTLRDLNITVTSFETFRYDGDDPNAFITAVNEFYKSNPGFCPLQEAFYPASNGLQFMTLAGNNATQVRGFLYDQSRKPKLTYAYFEGQVSGLLPAIACETAPAQ